MSSGDYWKKREQEAKKATIRDEEGYRKRIETIYKQTYEAVERQINDWYARYASKNGLSMSEARMRVKKLDMERYERLAAKYVATHDFSDQANEEMEIYNLTMRINRLELLKAQINLELLAGYDDLDKELEREFIEQAMKEDRRLAGILGDSVIGNQRYAKQIVNASFWNATYSERIWGNNMPRLRSSIETQLRNGIIQGIHPTELARKLRQSFDVSARDSERLMITEVRRIQTEIQKDSFDRNGFKEYRFISAGDGKVCPECERLHGQHFKVSEMQPGENAPPMHPVCRCSTAAYMDGDKYKRWLDALERGEDVRWKEFEKEGAEYFRNNLPKNYSDLRNISGSISEEELNKFISYATEKGIRIGADEKSRGNFDQYCGEPSVLYEMVDGLTKSIRFAKSMGLKVPEYIILNYDNVLGYQKDNSKIDIDAFASIKGKTITLNKFMFDDSAYLKQQYNDALGEAMFPRGTSYKNIANHEFGHILDKYNPGLRKKIINRLRVLAEHDSIVLEQYVMENISIYAADSNKFGDRDYHELISEIESMRNGSESTFAIKLLKGSD